MKKLSIILFIFNACYSFGQIDLHGQILNTDTIYKNVIIKNAIIEANPYIQIFDTSVILINCKSQQFSTAWYGAESSIFDNYFYLQKCINTCIANNITNLYCADNYHYSHSLLAFNIVGGRYIGFGLNFYGDGDHWNQRQTLTYSGSEFAYGVQCAKGGSFRGIALRGTNTGSGIIVDYDAGSGSTGYTIEDCYVGSFDVNFDISPLGTYNGDILRLNNIHSGKCNIAVRSASAQNKGNEINGFYSWDSCGTAFKITNGNWIIRGGNIASYCGQILDVIVSGWNTFSVQGLFAERVKSLGSVSARTSIYLPPVNLQDMDIRFIPGDQILFSSNSPKVRISNSALWFYSGVCCQRMNFSGSFIWDNNDCGNCDINDNQILYIKPGTYNPIL